MNNGRSNRNQSDQIIPNQKKLILWTGICIIVIFVVCFVIDYASKSEIRSNEQAAIGSLKTLAAFETDYNNNSQPHTYTGNISCLGTICWDVRFLDPALTSGVKSGYKIDVAASEPVNGSSWAWSATAWPIIYGKTGIRTFYIDETAVVRSSDIGGKPGTNSLPSLDGKSRYQGYEQSN